MNQLPNKFMVRLSRAGSGDVMFGFVRSGRARHG